MTSAAVSAAPLRLVRPAPTPLAIEVADVTKRFGQQAALSGVTLDVEPGPDPRAARAERRRQDDAPADPERPGDARRGQRAPERPHPHDARQLLGLVPAGDRSFYLRISALENLVFFGRLHGLRRREAVARARAGLEAVGLAGEERKRAGLLSKGMQRRLALARALLCDPAILLIDEATHDLDPDGARRVRALVIRAAAERSIAVLWTTQRLEEIAGFADKVTLLDVGRTRFCGSVDDLIAHSLVRRYVLTMPTVERDRELVARRAGAAVLGRAEIGIVPSDADRYVLELTERSVLGDVLASLTDAGFPIVACRPDRSEIEEAFIALTGDER